MAKSLKELLENSNKNKTRIGYNEGLSGYDTAVQQMGLLSGQKKKREEDVLDQEQSVLEAAATELGNFLFDDSDNTIDGEGMYNTHQTACVLIQPFLSFPYKDKADNQIKCLKTAELETSTGEVYQGGLMTIPDSFDKASIDACSSANSGDFIIGCSIGLGSGFLANYVAKFYPKIDVKKFQQLAKNGSLYGEIFLPTGTAGTSGKVMVCRVIKEASGQKLISQRTTQTNAIETIFFYNCFIPAPLLMVKGYKDNYTIADLSYNTITEPAFNQTASYSYAKAAIESFGPQTIQTYISSQGQIETVNGKVLWQPNQNASYLLGRFRFVVPPCAASNAISIIKEEDAPDLYKMTDPSIADGLTRISSGPIGQITEEATGAFYYPDKVKPYVQEQAWVKGFRVMWGMEVGNATPTLNDLVNNVIRLKYQGKEENWITAGPSQFIGQRKTSEKEPPGLEYYLKEICERTYGNISEENNNRIIAATHGLKTSDEMAEPHIKWIQALFKEAGLEILISSAIKVWCTQYYLDAAIRAYEKMQFQGICNLGFTMCMYLVNGGWGNMRGYGESGSTTCTGTTAIRSVSSNEEKCKMFVQNFNARNIKNLVNVQNLWRDMCTAGDYAFEAHYDLARYDKTGIV